MANPTNAQSPAVPFEPAVMERPSLSPDSKFSRDFHRGLEEVNLEKAKAAGESEKVRGGDKEKDKEAPKVDAKVEAKVEAKANTEDEFEPPKDVSPAGRESWKKQDASRKAAQKEAAEAKAQAALLKTQLTELTEKNKALADAVSPEEYKRLKTERDEYQMLVRQVSVQSDPQFKAYFKREGDKVAANVKAALGEQADAVLKILAMPEGEYKNAQLLDAMADMDALKQNRVVRAVDRLAELAGEREEAITKSAADFDAMAEKQKAARMQAQTEMKARNQKLFDTTLAKFTDPKEGLPDFIGIAGDDQSARLVKENIDATRKLVLGQNKPEELVETAFWAVRGLRSHVLLKAAGDRIEKLELQIAGMTGAQPKPPGGDVKVSADKTLDPGAGMNWAQKTAAMFRGEIPLVKASGE